MTSRQRKNIKKERQKIVDQNIEMIRLNGNEINHEMLSVSTSSIKLLI